MRLFKFRLNVIDAGTLLTIILGVVSGGCSLLVNNNAECQTARDTAKQFYSIHFDRELGFNKEKVQNIEKFLTPELAALLKKNAADEETAQNYSTKYRNPLTLSVDPPRTFRIGECRIEADTKNAGVETSVYWKTGNEQAVEKRLYLTLKPQNSGWLIENIADGKTNLKNIFEQK